MAAATGRLLFLFLSALTWIFLAVYALRSCGEKQQYGQFEHPLWTGQAWVVAMGGDSKNAPQFSPAAYRAAAALSPTVILGLQIRLTQDSQWIVYGPKDWSTHTQKSGLVSRTPSAELSQIRFKNTNEPIFTLNEFLKTFPSRPLWIEIVQPATAALKDLYASLATAQLERQVILTSPFHDTITDVRKQSAAWLSGASTSEVAKARLLNSLFLEPLMTLNGDIYFAQMIHARLLGELTKRKKIVLLQTDSPESYKPLHAEFPALGVVTNRPSLFISPATR